MNCAEPNMNEIQIECDVRDLDDVSLQEIIHFDRGVYVLWNGMAKKRPSYIGQGRILHRIPKFLDDEERARGDVRGFVLIPRCWRKTSYERETRILTSIERSLLDVSRHRGSFPRHNYDQGALSGFKWLIRYSEGNSLCIKISFHGPDPLLSPSDGTSERVGCRCSSHYFGHDRELERFVYDWEP